MRGSPPAWVLLFAVTGSVPAFADATVLLCEPYGKLGFFSPTGHMAIYFDRVCADSPTHLRLCQPGETGVVVSRYAGVGGLDWAAVPLIPYLYAVERAADAPASVTPGDVDALRDAYRRAHLIGLVPDRPDGRMPKGNWNELAGAAYDRRIVAFTVRTTADQDARLIRMLNERPNRSRFNFLFRNCADFVREILNVYFPNAFKRNIVGDLGFTTPKYVARTLTAYAARQPEIGLTAFVIPQVPGNKGPSKPARGVMEALVRKLMYVVPLAIVQPWIPPAFAAGWLVTGRFNAGHFEAAVYSPALVESWASQRVQQATVATGEPVVGTDGPPSETGALVATPGPPGERR
jgi:hypothetical protein